MNPSLAALSSTEIKPIISPGLIWKTTIVVSIFAILTLGLSVTGRWMGERIATGGHSVAKTITAIMINDEKFQFPANTIRFENQRAGGMMERADLYLLWPQMEGYSNKNRQHFNDTGKSGKMVFLTLKPASMPLDMSQRYEPVYLRLVNPAGETRGNGLTKFAFREDTRYVDEVLYVGDRQDADPFVVRCLIESGLPAGSRSCMRDIHIGENMSVNYRFSTELLPHWRALDAAIFDYVTGALQTEG
jgi:hypothetical protein